MKQYIERIGKFYSHIILENVGLFIAYGILSILFSEGGWFPSSTLTPIIEMIYFIVIPVLISYTTGRRIGGNVGGLVAAMAGLGFFSVDGSSYMLGALLTAPMAGWIAKRGLNWIKAHTVVGFEMLFRNLFIGIVGSILLLFSSYCFNPILNQLKNILTWLLDQLFSYNLVPFMSFLIEPGKVMFLNNTINHGLLVPLGIEQVEYMGSSVLFLLETNPVPGFGILLAYFLIEKKEKKNLLVNMVIQLVGGIHELYFPYVLSNSILFLAVIAGGMAGNFCFLLLQSGVIAPPSPGSILTILLLSPGKNLFGNLFGIAVSAMVSCIIAVIILKRKQTLLKGQMILQEESGEKNRTILKKSVVFENQDKTDQKTVWNNGNCPKEELEKNAELSNTEQKEYSMKTVKKVYFVCQGGFGSSAMGAAILRRKLKNAGFFNIEVANIAIDDIPNDADVIFCQKEIESNLKKIETKAEIHYLENLSQSLEYDNWISSLRK